MIVGRVMSITVMINLSLQGVFKVVDVASIAVLAEVAVSVHSAATNKAATISIFTVDSRHHAAAVDSGARSWLNTLRGPVRRSTTDGRIPDVFQMWLLQTRTS